MNYAGIFEIYCLPASALELPELHDYSAAGEQLPVSARWQQLETIGTASLSEETAEENGQTVYSVRLSFLCAEKVAFPSRRCVFRTCDVNGRNFLIGTGSRPHPSVTYKYTDSGPAGKKGYEYSVTYRNSTGLIPISA